jgi:hypothetical protein
MDIARRGRQRPNAEVGCVGSKDAIKLWHNMTIIFFRAKAKETYLNI